MRPLNTALAATLLFAMFSPPSRANHHPMTPDDLDYPGTIAIADGHGKVDVRIIFEAAEDCWRIVAARPGTPKPEEDLPSGRHLYITVTIEHTTKACVQKLTELQTRLMIDDRPGTLSLDIFFVDERGVYQRSQRHRIQR